MARKFWCFVAILFTSLTLGMTFAHVLELPAKVQYDGPLYARLQTSLYNKWGPTAAVTEPVEILAAGVLAYMARGRRPAFPLAALATVCLVLALGAFFIFNNPVNRAFFDAEPAVPANWQHLRAQWEIGHATSFVLHLTALCALLLVALPDFRVEHRQDAEQREALQAHAGVGD